MSEKKPKKEDKWAKLMPEAVEIFMTKDLDASSGLTLKKLAEPLVEKGMTESSAIATFGCYRKLTKGEPFNRNIQKSVMEPLLVYLHKHKKKDILENVFKGLDKYFEMREDSNISAKELVAKYKKEFKM